MKCIIYKLWKEGENEVYIGSTSDFKKRMIQHKSDSYNEKRRAYNMFIYQYIRKNGGWEEFNKEIIYECEVEDKYEKFKIEGEYIKKYEQHTLNERNSYGCKEYKEYKEYHKDKKQKYYEKNKDKLKDINKKYYEQNKDKLNEKKARQVNCPHCNKEMRKDSLTRHIKTQH